MTQAFALESALSRTVITDKEILSFLRLWNWGRGNIRQKREKLAVKSVSPIHTLSDVRVLQNCKQDLLH